MAPKHTEADAEKAPMLDAGMSAKADNFQYPNNE